MAVENTGHDDFVSFYREYARTGIHAAATALLTMSGLLASLAGNWIFIVAGVATYVVPPAYLYVARDHSAADGATTAADADAEEKAEAAADSTEPAQESVGVEADDESGGETATGGATAGETESDRDRTGWEWRPASVGADADLADAAAAADGVYAAGTGGVLLARRNGEWEAVVDDGAGGDGNDFTAVDATADGRAVWAVGDSGAVARYDVASDRHVDFSAPDDLTSTWTGVAVAGSAGEETVYLANGSGVVLRGVLADGDATWGDETKPGSGSSVADLAFEGPQRGLLCDTAGGVFETLDGDAFERIGIDDLDGEPTAVVARGADGADADGLPATVATDDGSLHGRDRAGWTRDAPTDAALFDLAAGRDERLAVGADGTILADTGDGWTDESTPTDAALRGVALPADDPAAAVGDEGTVIERRPVEDEQ